MIIIAMLPHVNPPLEKAQEQSPAAGAMLIEMFWPDEHKSDVDLWVRGPAGIPVGFSNRSGKNLNLLRDDLGTIGDYTNRNYEHMFSRALRPGEYQVNVALYQHRKPDPLPIPVRVRVTAAKERGDQMKQVFVTDVKLLQEDDEQTALRFEIGGEGKVSCPDREPSCSSMFHYIQPYYESLWRLSRRSEG